MGDVFVIVAGGLGEPQTAAIIAALRPLEPMGVRIWTPPMGNDQYKGDFVAAAMVRPAKKLAIIGHSFAGQTAIEADIELAKQGVTTDYLGLMEPTAFKPIWADLELPQNGAAPAFYDWLRASNSFPVHSAYVDGAIAQRIDGTNHNSLCRHPAVIKLIYERVRTLAVLSGD